MSTEPIEATLARAIVENPALEPLTNAFGPMLVARNASHRDISGWQGALPPLDGESFSGGQPLLPEAGFQCPAKGLPEMVLALIPVLNRTLPGLAEDLSILEAAVVKGEAGVDALWAAAFGHEAAVNGVSPQSLAFVAAEAARPFLARQAQDLAPLIDGLPWTQGCCPVCGGAPHMSVLRKPEGGEDFITAHGGKRFLRCSCCATEWTFKRVSCPACGCEEPDDLLVLRDPERPFERADACKRCHSFLLCLDSAELVAVPHPDVAALVMAPLETKALAQGFHSLAAHAWSGLVE